jgi:hypothetical protein
MADTWTIDELKALTSEVQTEDIKYKGKTLSVQWCELTEAEEPRMKLPDDDLPEEEKTLFYTEIGTAKVMAMVTKANSMNPEGTTIDEESWEHLPSTLRYNISTVVLGAGEQVNKDF